MSVGLCRPGQKCIALEAGISLLSPAKERGRNGNYTGALLSFLSVLRQGQCQPHFTMGTGGAMGSSDEWEHRVVATAQSPRSSDLILW